MKVKEKNTTSWLKFRHTVVYKVLTPFISPYIRLRYNIRIQRFRDKRPVLIVMNHQTGFDQFFPALSLRRPIYFLASEDIFSIGFLANVLRYLVAPIPIKKQTMDIQAVKTCIRVAREGGTICLAPEGNRTYHGRTGYMNPSIAGLAKKLGLPLVIYRIEGGYGVQPRWSDVVRRGNMRAYVKRVIEPEEYRDMTNQALADLIQQELWVDEAAVTGEFHHRKNAEFLERVVYTCPWCGLTTWESHADTLTCQKCGRRVRHLPTKQLQGVDCAFPHSFVADWYDWQEQFLNEMDTTALVEDPLYEETVQMYRVIPYKRKELLKKNCTIRLYGDRITVDDRAFPFADTNVVILGKNKLNLYADDGVFQIRGDKRFNGLKYLNFSYRYKNITTGGTHGKFLGL